VSSVIGNAPPRRDRFAIVALLVLSSCAPVAIGGKQASVARVTEVRIQISPERAVATLLIGGKTVGIPFATDLALVDPAGEQDVEIIRAFGEGGVMVLDTHASRPASLGRCGAGREQWIRVFSARTATQTFQRQVESCLNDIIPADPPVTWSGDGQHFSIKLLSAPNAAPTTRYSISGQGLVTTG
jgi:hypothetical protein